MGVSYTVVPIGAHLDIPTWLKALGIETPPSFTVQSRNPTPAEIRSVLEGLPSYRVEYSVGERRWDADIRSTEPSNQSWACVWVHKFNGDENEPHEFSFHKGWIELNLLIAQKLSEVSGALLVIPDSTGTPIVVTPETDLEAAIAAA